MIKKKQIYIYINSDKTYIFLKHKNKTIIENNNNNIIKNSEIVNVEKTLKHLLKIDKKHNIYNGYLKPDIIVLYNDFVDCDIIYLYKAILQDFNYKNISFIKISELIKKLKNNERILLYENNTYTSFHLTKKYNSIDNLSFKPIIVGNINTTYTHYADKDFIWNTFLRYFTKN